MKAKLKRKNAPTRSASKRLSSTSRTVKSHFAGSRLARLNLVEHKHTGKLIHHRHTSHGLLMVILLMVGFLLFASGALVSADPIVSSGAVSVGVVVPGPAPTIGATITSPINGATIVDRATIQVNGTCAASTFVVVSSNNSIVGSTMCTVAGIFVLTIQPSLGQNVLSAKNYDGLNQPGPDTPSVTITVTKTSGGKQSTSTRQAVLPKIPTNPSIIPSINPSVSECEQYKAPKLPTGGELRIAVVCIPRVLEPNTQYTLGILVWGGSAPYAVDIDWGDATENTLISLASQGYKTINFKYANSGVHTLTFKLKDKDANAAFVQTGAVVNGETKQFFTGIRDNILRISWFETPVPLYFLAVAMTLGFWGGDIFDRRFGITKHYRKTRKAA